MKPIEQHLLSMLSNNDVTFFIPPYQRNYEWTDDQCEVFFNDVIKVTESNLSGVRSEHFFGTIVYVLNEHVFGEPDILVLTDGQQRITTTMLFLAAIRDSIDDEKVKLLIDNRYLKNNNVTSDTEYKIKLKQVETDWESYKNIVLGQEVSPKDMESRVWQNYSYFLARIKSDLSEKEYPLTDLIEHGLEKFSLVTIQLEPDKNSWENPQEIFESMNSLGKPLSLADLVRNYLLLGKTADEQEHLYHDFWLPMEKTLSGEISNFIRDYMQLVAMQPFKKATERNYKELYSQFKDLLGNNEAQEILEGLKKYSKFYAQIVLGLTTGDIIVDRKLADLRTIDVTIIHSVLMVIIDELAKGNITTKETAEMLETFVIYFLRRRIMRMTQGENRVMPRMIQKIRSLVNSDNKKQELLKLLATQDYYLRLPNDTELKQQLSTMNFYNFSQGKFILSLVEEKLTKFRPESKDKNLQVEHIMPQTLNDEWKQELGENCEDIYQEFINNIGNLTLIRHNQELGNKSFKDKKEVYANNAGLQIAKTKIVDTKNWNEESIKNRRDWIVDYVIKEIVPIPLDMRQKNNYVNRESRIFTFGEHGLIGKYITYIYDNSIVAKVVNNREVEFEGKRWKLSPLVCELETRRGTVNKSKAYSGPSYWLYKGERIFEYFPDGEDK